MIKKVFTLYDSASELYLPPFYQTTKGAAIRDIQDGMKKNDSILSVHKEDLTLYEIGEYDDNTAALHATLPRVLIGQLKDLEPNTTT